jgi:ABC-type antimicrobial peptide transport system permease subunit
MSSLGLVIGVLLGSTLAWYLSFAGFSYPGMEEMAGKFNLPDRMYPSLSPLSMLLGPGIVFFCSLLASLYPALRLFFLQPVNAMKAV